MRLVRDTAAFGTEGLVEIVVLVFCLLMGGLEGRQGLEQLGLRAWKSVLGLGQNQGQIHTADGVCACVRACVCARVYACVYVCVWCV